MSRGPHIARRQDRGVTLLEILIVLAILGAAVAVLMVGLGRARKLDLREKATQLAAGFRSAFDRTAATAAAHRVVIDFDTQSFTVERCEGKVILRRSTDEAAAAETAKALEQEERIRAEEAARQAAEVAKAGTQNGVTAEVAPPPDATKALGAAECVPIKGRLGKGVKLSTKRGIKLRTAYVAHLSEPVTTGRVTINFFPPGRGERAVVEIEQGEDVFSVVVHPLTGRVISREGAWEHPEDFVTSDAEGTRVEEDVR